MEKPNNDFELIYKPSIEKGEELFDGLPCPTEEAFEILGDEGVAYIKNRLNEMLEWRKIMYSAKEKKYYGFSAMQFFTELQSKIVFSVGLTINNLKLRKSNSNREIPNLVISDDLKEQNFKKLHNTNHFLIEIYWEYPYSHPNISISDFYRYHLTPNN